MTRKWILQKFCRFFENNIVLFLEDSHQIHKGRTSLWVASNLKMTNHTKCLWVRKTAFLWLLSHDLFICLVFLILEQLIYIYFLLLYICSDESSPSHTEMVSKVQSSNGNSAEVHMEYLPKLRVLRGTRSS